MFFRVAILFVFVTTAMAAVSSQTGEKPATSKMDYKWAIENIKSKKACKKLASLAQSQNFELKSLAKLRHLEHCDKKPNWAKARSEIKGSLLKPFINRAEFEWLKTKKKFKQAYRLFNKNRNDIDLDNQDFDDLAVQALKTSLSKSEKKQLRKELRKKSPRYIPSPKKSEYLKVARDFRRDRKFEKALYYYRKVINDTKMSYHERWNAFKGARITYKLERWSRMKKYIRASKQWGYFLESKYKWSKEMSRLHHNANIEYIRTLWTEKGQKQAIKRLSQIEKQLKGRHSMQLVYWLKGRMAEERKEYKNAVKWLSKAAKEKSLSARDKERVLWALAWNQRRVKSYSASQKTLEKLKKSPELTFFGKTKYLYWQAANIYDKGEKKAGLKAFRRLAELDLYGYYGALAYRKLGTAFPKPPAPSIKPEKVLKFFKANDRKLFVALRDVGEIEVADSLVSEKVKTKKSWGADKWVAYLKLLQEAGAYKSFFYRYHSLKPKLQLSVLEEHPYLLFPQPYKQEVKESSKLTQISPALIYSIMKQESGFDVKARSHADAFGLLQLIPQVAKKAAQGLPTVKYSEPFDLYKPGVVIPLGAQNLKQLFSKFNSSFILSVASYNASEKAVKGWVKSRFNGDPVTFIEDIPYEETKGYVKLVMRNYITYNRFDNHNEPFKFPEVCLEGLQRQKR